MHIHGGLRLEIAGRLVPHLGYWGANDVCFGQWLAELAQVSEAISSPGGRHVFDEGEQGQAAFVFERDGDRAFFTIADAEMWELKGGKSDPDWQRIEFCPFEFVSSYERFRESFLKELHEAAPQTSKEWLSRVLLQ